MKSLEFGGQCFPLLSVSPPLSLIDSTKVQHIHPLPKDKIKALLIDFFVLK
jgi:hypothetical protein